MRHDSKYGLSSLASEKNLIKKVLLEERKAQLALEFEPCLSEVLVSGLPLLIKLPTFNYFVF